MLALVVVLGVAMVPPSDAAWAAERTFMGIEIEAHRGSYLVTAAVNIRARPTANSEKLGLFEEDQIIEVVGRVDKGAWVAVIDQGQPAGFVYGKAVLPLIDGRLSEPLRGVSDAAEGPPCRYEIRFVGRSRVPDQPARIADYVAELECGTDADGFRLPAPMFLTETPYDFDRNDRVFQLNVDLLSSVLGRDEIEGVFSTIFLFDLDAGQVRFDGVTNDSLVRSGVSDLSRPATEPAGALRAAVEMALDVWNAELWQAARENAG